MSSADSGDVPRRSVRFLGKAAPAAPPASAAPASDVPARARRIRFISRDTEGADSGPVAPSLQGTSQQGLPDGAAAVPQICYSLDFGARVRITPSIEVCRALVEHCSQSNRHGKEIGGVLVGLRSSAVTAEGAPEYSIDVTDIIPVIQSSNSPSHVQFDQPFWERVDDEMNAKFVPAGKCRVGWYHTHPHQGIFFSGLDRDAHTIFRQPYQFAIVVDPRQMDAGLFYWKDRERTALGGAVRFSLVPDSRSSSLPPVNRRSSGSGETKWFAIAGAGVCVALILGGFVKRPERLSYSDLALFGVAVVAGAFVILRALEHASIQILRNSRLRDAFSMAVLVVLTFWSGVRYSASVVPIAQTAVEQTRPVVPPKVSAGTREPQAVGVRPPAPAEAGMPGAARKLAFVVDQSSKGSNRRVVIESKEPKASIAFQLRRCRYGGASLNLARCVIQVDRARERNFVNTICTDLGTTETCIRQVQQGLGFSKTGVDGRWGPVTRVRFIGEAIRSRGRSGNPSQQLLFERKSSSPRQQPRNAAMRVKFLPAG